MDMGGLMEDASVDDVPNPFDEENVRLLEVPVDFRLRLPTPKLQPYLMGGPVVRFNATDDEDRFRSLSLAGGAGVGLELPIGRFVIYPELKYTFGITRANAAVAESGTIMLKDGDTASRLGALAPWIHIAVIEATALVATLPDLDTETGYRGPTACRAAGITYRMSARPEPRNDRTPRVHRPRALQGCG